MSQIAGKAEIEPHSQAAANGAELVLRVPDTALIPEGASFYQGDDDRRCRLVKPDGTRCGGTRMKSTGLCPGHSGIGGVATDPHSASRKAATERSRRRTSRMLLGVSARRASSPAQLSRVRAQERADEIAAALIDAPLDDPELGSVARQRAVLAALDHLYPQVTASLDVELPAEPDEVGSMGWQDMQALAARLLEE